MYSCADGACGSCDYCLGTSTGRGFVIPKSPNTPEPPPLPNPGEPAVWDLVRVDIEERDRHGVQKYGQPLTAGDGRDSLIDLYQELLDAVVYIRKEIREREIRKQSSITERALLDRIDTMELGSGYLICNVCHTTFLTKEGLEGHTCQ